MGSLFASTMNTRILPTGSLRWIRSDAPLHLTVEEIGWLRNHDVTTAVDLRGEDEILREPSCLEHTAGFTCHHLPVTAGPPPASPEEVPSGYLSMVDGKMEEIIHFLLHAKTPVLYFCRVGKDRTGVVSAIILKKLGIPDDVILRDYMESRENLMDYLIVYAREHPGIRLETMIPKEDNLRPLLASL